MLISYSEEEKIFHLKAADMSYIIQICDDGKIAHAYWGRTIKNINFRNKSIISTLNYDPKVTSFNMDVLPQEYPAYGTGDFRSPAYHVQLENGSTISNLVYNSYKIYGGKPKLEGLPATYVENDDEADTLEITMIDKLTGLNVVLTYTVFKNYNVITRSTKFINYGREKLKLLKVMSASVDFDSSNYDMLQLSGSWAREKSIYRHALVPGIQAVDSARGFSSAQQNPFIALLSKNTDEINGEVFGFSLVYSGNFLAEVYVDQFLKARVNIGINPFDFSWVMTPGESFRTPEVVMVYSKNGLGDMSRTYHKLYRNRLCRGLYRDKERPILINNWEATYFNFTEEKIKDIAKAGSKLGIELFVLDDGWFGKRNSDNCSLGDWVEDRNKLPNGLHKLVKDVNDMGLAFGIWFEPEMVSPDSDLYRKHQDWCLHVSDRERSSGKHQRNQLVLDLSRKDVCDEIIRFMSEILKNANISYVKWDMNRPYTEIGSEKLSSEHQRETAHRYVLGLYRVMDEITSRFPNVLFESCASGGGRFDPGILYYMPQTWTSDCTDAVERLKIQYGTSVVYPNISMGAHVSACPNHQIGRITDMETRGNVAMAGNFGYELDLTKLTEEEKIIVKKQVEIYKEIRHIIQFGDFYRILSPFEGNETAWISVTEDKKEAVVSYFKVLAEPNILPIRIKLQGLDPSTMYEIIGEDMICSGDELMYIGIEVPRETKDFSSIMWRLKEV